MEKNPYDGLIMRIDFEEKEWSGNYLIKCSLCSMESIWDNEDTPIVLTYIENVPMDKDKYFCSYDCMENWLNKFVVNK